MFRHASGKTKVEIVILKNLEIYTLSTYSDVMSYVVREPEIRHVVVRESRIQESNILHGTEIGGKECSDDSD